jgi:hypothetical protein
LDEVVGKGIVVVDQKNHRKAKILAQGGHEVISRLIHPGLSRHPLENGSAAIAYKLFLGQKLKLGILDADTQSIRQRFRAA